MSRINIICCASIIIMLLFVLVGAIAMATPKEIADAEEMISYSQEPKMTILVPGINEDSSIWSNVGNSFAYESTSLIEMLSQDKNIVKTYTIKIKSSDFVDGAISCDYVTKELAISGDNYIKSAGHISTNQKYHNLIVYEDCIDNNNLPIIDADSLAYKRFEFCLNDLINNWYEVNGFYPTINIVGHGRGGLVAVNYLCNYSNFVNKVFTIGTNYSGSALFKIYKGTQHNEFPSIINKYPSLVNSNLSIPNNIASKIYAIGSAMDYGYIAALSNQILALSESAYQLYELKSLLPDINLNWEQKKNELILSWNDWSQAIGGIDINESIDALEMLIDVLSNKKNLISMAMYLVDVFEATDAIEFCINKERKLLYYDEVHLIDCLEGELDNKNKIQKIKGILDGFEIVNGAVTLVKNYIGFDYDYKKNPSILSLIKENAVYNSLKNALKLYIENDYENTINLFAKYRQYATNNNIDISAIMDATSIETKAESIAKAYADEMFNIYSDTPLLEKIDVLFLIKFMLAMRINSEEDSFVNISFEITDEVIRRAEAFTSLYNITLSNNTNMNSNIDIRNITNFLIDIIDGSINKQKNLLQDVYCNKEIIQQIVGFLDYADVAIKGFRLYKKSVQLVSGPFTVQLFDWCVSNLLESAIGFMPGFVELVSDFKLKSELQDDYESHWYDVFNCWGKDDFVFANDGINSLSSQLGNEYVGINRKSFLLGAEDCTVNDIGNKKYPIPIAHNIECQNCKIVQYITSSIGLFNDSYMIEPYDGGCELVSICGEVEGFNYIIPQQINGLNVKALGKGLFNDARFKGIKQITIPNSVSIIKEEAFANCEMLEVINIPNDLTKICAGAFCNCKSLESISFDSALELKTIEYKAFWGCGLKSIHITKSLETIEPAAFGNCKHLKRFTISALNSEYAVDDDVLYSKDYKRIIQYPIGANRKVYNVGENVEVVGEYAFSNCSIDTIHFNMNLKEIKEYAFYNCEQIEYIKLWDNMNMIQSYAFGKCQNLKEVVIYDMTPNVAISAFDGCCDSLVYYLPIDAIEQYKKEPGLLYENNIESIAYSLTLKYCLGKDDIKISEYCYGRSLNDTLHAMNIHEYVDDYIIKDQNFSYIENGELVFDGWRYECDEQGNGTGTNVFNEFDYNDINSSIVLYAKWRPKVYYLQFVFGDNCVYVSKDGITSTITSIDVSDYIDFSNYYWDWYKAIIQTTGEKIDSFDLIIEPSQIPQSQNGEMLESEYIGAQNFSLPSVEETYQQQFEIWTCEINSKIRQISNSTKDGMIYKLKATTRKKRVEFCFDCSGGDYCLTNSTIEYGENYCPMQITRTSYIFGGWRIESISAEEDMTVYSEYEKYLGRMYSYETVPDFTFGLSKDAKVLLKAVWSAYVIDVHSGTSNIINNHDVVIMDFNQAPSMNKTFRITNDVHELTIKNMHDLIGISFVIEGNLIMNVNNCNFTASDNASAIYAVNKTLTMYFSGNNHIYGGTRHDVNTTFNAMAIVASTLKIYSVDNRDNFFYGGNGRKGVQYGENGINGGNGICATNLYIYSGVYYIRGGKGGDGAKGFEGSLYAGTGGNGGNGGNGGYAIWLIGNKLNIETAKVYCYGGSGGTGGDGGKGGTGQPGADATWKSTAKTGGQGGQGGDGGRGGHGASAVQIPLASTSSIVSLSAGKGGIGGIKGFGGDGGKGGKKKVGSGYASTGPKGNDGKPGSTGRTNYNYGIN